MKVVRRVASLAGPLVARLADYSVAWKDSLRAAQKVVTMVDLTVAWMVVEWVD